MSEAEPRWLGLVVFSVHMLSGLMFMALFAHCAAWICSEAIVSTFLTSTRRTVNQIPTNLSILSLVFMPTNPHSATTGICRIVPPKGWKPGFSIESNRFRTRVQVLWSISSFSSRCFFRRLIFCRVLSQRIDQLQQRNRGLHQGDMLSHVA